MKMLRATGLVSTAGDRRRRSATERPRLVAMMARYFFGVYRLSMMQLKLVRPNRSVCSLAKKSYLVSIMHTASPRQSIANDQTLEARIATEFEGGIAALLYTTTMLSMMIVLVLIVLLTRWKVGRDLRALQKRKRAALHVCFIGTICSPSGQLCAPGVL